MHPLAHRLDCSCIPFEQDVMSCLEMDAFKIDYEDFWKTPNRGSIASVMELRTCRFKTWARPSSAISLDATLVNCKLIFLFRFPRCPDLRVSSECQVRGIGPRFRNLAGVPQTMVMLTRSDGTHFEIGLNMENYWRQDTDAMDYNWFVKR